MFKKVAAFGLLSALVASQLQVPLHHQINQMLTGEVGVGHLMQFNLVHGQYFAANIDILQLNPHCDWVGQIAHIGWNVNPFARFRSLHFGLNSKLKSESADPHLHQPNQQWR